MGHSNSHKRQCKRKCAKPISIRQNMVGTSGLVISEPGVYQFCENITFSPEVIQKARSSSKVNVDVKAIKAAVKSVFHAGRKVSPSLSEVVKALHEINPELSSNSRSLNALAVQGRPAAITIASSDVYIDMKNYKLEQGNSNVEAVGFEILSGLNNITIVNGTITKFIGGGIHSFVDTSVPENIQKIINLRFENLNVINNGADGDESQSTTTATGIEFSTELDSLNDNFIRYLEFPAYENILISNCRVNGNTHVGISVTGVRGLTIQNTNVDGNFVKDTPNGFITAVVGLSLVQCDNLKLINSTFDKTNYIIDPEVVFGGFVIAGLLFSWINNLLIDRCSFNGTNGSSIFVQSALGTNNKNVLMKNSQFSNTRAGVNTGNVGFHISDYAGSEAESQGYLVMDCQFNDNVLDIPDTFFDFIVVHGIDWLTMKSVTFDRCQSSGHQLKVGELTGGKNGYITVGFNIGCASSDPLTPEIASGRAFRFRNCTASNLFSIGDVLGFQLFTGRASESYPQTTFGYSVEDCNVTYLRTDSVEAGTSLSLSKAAGVHAFSTSDDEFSICQDVQVKNTRIVDIARTTPIVGPDSNVAGILMSKVLRPILSGNSVGNCSNGIYLSESSKVTVKENEVSNCSLAGYTDEEAITSTSWVKNLSSNNGSHYNINWLGPVPVQTGYIGSNAWFNIEL